MPTCTLSNVSFRTALHISSVVNELLSLGGASDLRSPHIIAVGKINCKSLRGSAEGGRPHSQMQRDGLEVEDLKTLDALFPNAVGMPLHWETNDL